jgi:hypothetical protein
MTNGPLVADIVKHKVQMAASRLGTASPLGYVGGLIDRSFPLPAGSPEYGQNHLTPGAVPFEPSFSEREPDTLRFSIVPLAPGSSPGCRRDEATREMRRLVGSFFGHEALRWFDTRSEEWRGLAPSGRLHFGAWFGTAFDPDGLSASKVYYEMEPGQLDALPVRLKALVQLAQDTVPALVPVFTSISCERAHGGQRVTFAHRGSLHVGDLAPFLARLGLGHQLPSLMQVVGLCLGGRFDLPENSVLIGLRESEEEGPELKLEVLLGTLPDLPASFLDLLRLGLAERPRELRALDRWVQAFTPESYQRPGEFSVLSIRCTARTPARVSVYLRPIEFELRDQLRRAAAGSYAA